MRWVQFAIIRSQVSVHVWVPYSLLMPFYTDNCLNFSTRHCFMLFHSSFRSLSCLYREPYWRKFSLPSSQDLGQNSLFGVRFGRSWNAIPLIKQPWNSGSMYTTCWRGSLPLASGSISFGFQEQHECIPFSATATETQGIDMPSPMSLCPVSDKH